MPKRKKSSEGMPKRKKSSEGMPKTKNSSEGQDYISNLPDFIIGHILSFLSTKNAVRTSVLSKRWIYTWTFVTKLYLCDGENSYPHSYKSIKQFSNFVSRVLFHINSTSIQSFHLSMGAEYDADFINGWLSAVLKKGVKKICVKSLNNYDLSFYPLFQSSFLEKLVLKMKVGCIFKVSTFVCLPSLTSLSFVGITFTRYSSDKLNELTLKLPLLRNYSTTDCTWLGVKSVTFEAPLLEQVNMSYSTPRRKSRTKIKFCASHLKLFVYQGYIPSLSETIVVDGYIVSTIVSLPNLKDTSVEKTWVSFRRFLSFFTNTECLQLSLFHLQCPTQVEHHLAGYPAFQMLRDMQLDFVTGGVLLSLLLKSPCLKTLDLQMDKSDEETQNFAIVPDCFLSTLKVVKILSFSGSEGELSFAKFVMENARVLERINFTFLWRLPSSEVEKAKEKLFSFEKSRSTLIMEFSTYGN